MSLHGKGKLLQGKKEPTYNSATDGHGIMHATNRKQNEETKKLPNATNRDVLFRQSSKDITPTRGFLSHLLKLNTKNDAPRQENERSIREELTTTL